MFIFSFKASSAKLIGVVCACLAAGAAVIACLPSAGAYLNVNKLEISKTLSETDVKNADGRMEFFGILGYETQKEPVSTTSERVPEVLSAAEERYNSLQRSQGFDLTRYAGKNVTGYTYKVTSLPDGTKLGDEEYLATLVVYKNKVIAADLCCIERQEYYPLVRVS